MPDMKFDIENNILNYSESIELFKKAGHKVIELIDGKSKIATVPALGDRIFAADAGNNSKNPFFINQKDILHAEGSEKLLFPNGFGKRIWTGPEGAGKYSLYHKKYPLTFENNWFVPKSLNTPQLETLSFSSKQTTTKSKMSLTNLLGKKFEIQITSATFLMPQNEIKKTLDEAKAQQGNKIDSVMKDVKSVGVRREVSFKNTGSEKWGEKHGEIFIWDASMLISDDKTKVIIPYKQKEKKPVEDYLFDNGKPIPAHMKKQYAGMEIISANGLVKWKIGLNQKNAFGIVLSYIPSISTLAVLKYTIEDGNYMSNKWTPEPQLGNGAVMEAYNNYGLDQKLPGRFHELEVHSPNLSLMPGEESKPLRTSLIFFIGEKTNLLTIAKELCGGNEVF